LTPHGENWTIRSVQVGEYKSAHTQPCNRNTAAFRNPGVIKDMIDALGPDRVTVAIHAAQKNAIPEPKAFLRDKGVDVPGD